jgi:hypothetical protein
MYPDPAALAEIARQRQAEIAASYATGNFFATQSRHGRPAVEQRGCA